MTTLRRDPEPADAASDDADAERARAAAADAEAIGRFLQGQRNAFAELVERHQPRIYHLALRMTGSADDALDVTQDAFAKALTKLAGLDEPRYFGSWLYRIAVNTAISRGRRASKAPTNEDPTMIADRAPSPSGGPSDAAEADERAAAVHAALAELPPAQRAAVTLCDLEGHSYQAIARLLDQPIGTVMSRIHYGRKKLRARLQAVLG